MNGSALSVIALSIVLYVAAYYVLLAPPTPSQVPVFVLVSGVIVGSGRAVYRWRTRTRVAAGP